MVAVRRRPGRAALREALKQALRLGHNYIGTEHLLLGILFAKGDAGQLLIDLGLTTGQAGAGGARQRVRPDPGAAGRRQLNSGPA
jgi:Clp amino terminal domain, pathogenicity island component